jgi:hypothetical protein
MVCKERVMPIRTIRFHRGTMLRPETVAFQKFEIIPSVNSIPAEQQSLIPATFVLPKNSHIAAPSQNLVTYLGREPEKSKTYSIIMWDFPVLVAPDGTLVSFEGRMFERTEFQTRFGNRCELMVESYHQSFATPNPDKSFTGADYVLLNNPAPRIKNQNVTYFSINGCRKKVISYEYNVVSGECVIKYSKWFD